MSNLKTSLSNNGHKFVLETVGLSPKPMSTTDIERKCPTGRNSNVYTIVRDLFGQSNQIRFLKISYKDNIHNEISRLEDEFDLHPETTVSIIADGEQAEWDSKRTEADFKISDLKNNKSNWRYSLNLKGFLLYLLAVDKNKRAAIPYTKINRLIMNIKYKDPQEFSFLKYFDIFDEIQGSPNRKIDLLFEITLELQHQLKEITAKFLREYSIRRCYDEISSWDAINDMNPFKRAMSKRVKKNHLKLKQYKLAILNQLIPSEKNLIKNMMQDLDATKRAINEMKMSSAA